MQRFVYTNMKYMQRNNAWKSMNTLRQRQYGCHGAGHILELIFFCEHGCVLI